MTLSLVLGFTVLAGLCVLLLALPAVQAQTTRVVVVSDLNESDGSTRCRPAVGDAVRRAIALQPDLVISTGDRIAAQRLV